MITQSFDLFGTPDAPVTVNTARTPHQAMLFAGDLFAHVDPNAAPAEAVALDPALHDATVDTLAQEHAAAEAELMADIVGDPGAPTDDYICPATGLTRAELAGLSDAAFLAPTPAPAPAKPGPPVAAGTRRVAGAGEREYRYVGVVRIAGGRGTGPVITECGHEHYNRDWSTGAAGGSAKDCAKKIIAGAENPATAEHHATRFRQAPMGLRPGAGFTPPAGLIEAAKATAEANATGYLTAVATVRQHLNP